MEVVDDDIVACYNMADTFRVVVSDDDKKGMDLMDMLRVVVMELIAATKDFIE